MANKYGLKEVADFKLYPVGSVVCFMQDDSGKYTGEYKVYPAGTTTTTVASAQEIQPTYLFDSLKVSSLEFASEEVSARGGKGNPELITWYYGKTGTLSLTDALLSDETLKLLAGGTDHQNGMVTIDAKTFNQGYMMIGDTIMRSKEDQKDYPYLMYIPSGSLSVGGTFSLEAEGDPSTFEFSSKVMAADITCLAKKGNTYSDAGEEKGILVKFVRGNVGVDNRGLN